MVAKNPEQNRAGLPRQVDIAMASALHPSAKSDRSPTQRENAVRRINPNGS